MKAANQIHLKYVRDLTLAEAISLPEQLVKVPDNERAQPDNYHARTILCHRAARIALARTGHILPNHNSKVFEQLKRTQTIAEQNEMKLNFKKTKLITFNPCRTKDFMPGISLDGN